ncbi:respiratory nitrate reductase subunit gamma [Nocardia ninae]|uniref:Nitrate reductase subunit gamma n=1 Tax=Nocardia ninae NBRC 108245 TaxID=1210091 RepID=A0A511M985_9NOCA|nr:respiratory nitrate reductase subunit gamma [Nocardia ninae]GEM36678.1 nitrate reductase subunit gamma [Nocardia ninae NBRC 108245]
MMSVLWIVLPYSALLSFIIGHFWRYRHDRFGWYSTGPEADRAQRIGGTAFRVGMAGMIAARLTDLLVSGPNSHPDNTFYVVVVAVEVCAVAVATVGAVLLFVPDMIGSPGRPVISPLDSITFPMLVAGLLTRVAIKFDPNSSENGYRTAETLFTWFRSLWTLHPNPEAMVHAPFIYQARGLVLMLFVAIWPYTRLASILAEPVYWLIRRIRSEPPTGRPRELSTP